MNQHCKICSSAFGIIPDYSEPNFYIKLINKEIISRKYKCQDCGATFTYNKETGRWDYDKNIDLKTILSREIK